MEIKIVELNDSFVHEAGFLLAAYKFASGWDGQKQKEVYMLPLHQWNRPPRQEDADEQ
ncbi:hypothetical protein [Paenibacillus pinihumi]|uniref:hypothetical protein n=1 Tax=Paenibacillus pinihumi TaxID=669462 RepID=UPI000420EF5F|nr:hypothetical protein [Paenibacillus pinihumi]